MRQKVLILAAAGMLVMAGCKKDKKDDSAGGNGNSSVTVENKQRTLMAYVSATWCGPCGQYGGPTFKTAAANAGDDKIIALNIQTSNSKLTPYFKKPSSMDNQDSVFIGPVFPQLFSSLNIPTDQNGSFSIPAFSENNTYVGTSNTPNTTLETNANNYNANAPVVGVGANASINGNTITVNAKAKFFKQGSGTYHWVALVIEKLKVGYQQVGGSTTNTYEHKHTVRASMQNGLMHNQSIFGNSFATGTINTDTEFEKTFTLEFQKYDKINPAFGLLTWDSIDKSNTQIAVMVWKQNGAKFEYVNGILVNP